MRVGSAGGERRARLELTDRTHHNIIVGTPLRAIGTPSDIAYAVLYLASGATFAHPLTMRGEPSRPVTAGELHTHADARLLRRAPAGLSSWRDEPSE